LLLFWNFFLANQEKSESKPSFIFPQESNRIKKSGEPPLMVARLSEL